MGDQQPWARAPDERNTRLRRAIILMRSPKDRQFHRGFDEILLLMGHHIQKFAERSIHAHASRYPRSIRAIEADFQFHAQNVVEEIVIVVYRKGGVFYWKDPAMVEQNLRNWLSKTARNVARSYVRGLQKEPEVILFSEIENNERQADDWWLSDGSAHELDEAMIQNELINLMMRAIRTLDEEDRELLMQKDFHGRSYRELARMTGEQASTLRVRVWRIRREVRGRMLEMSETSSRD